MSLCHNYEEQAFKTKVTLKLPMEQKLIMGLNEECREHSQAWMGILGQVDGGADMLYR